MTADSQSDKFIVEGDKAYDGSVPTDNVTAVQTVQSLTEWAWSAVGVSREKVQDLLTRPDLTDDWSLEEISQPVFRSLGFWMLVCQVIEDSQHFTFNSNLTCVFENLLQSCKCVRTFLRKLRNKCCYFSKRDWNYESLMYPIVSLPADEFPQILREIGISEQWLENPLPIDVNQNSVNKAIVCALRTYKIRKNVCYHKCSLWIKYIYKLDRKPNPHTLRSQWDFIHKKKQNLSCHREQQEIFLGSKYDPVVARPVSSASESMLGSKTNSNVRQSESMRTQNDKLLVENETLKNHIQSITYKKKNVSLQLYECEKKVKSLESQQQNTIEKIKSFSVRNVNKRLKRKQKKITSLLSENSRQKQKLASMMLKCRKIQNRYQRLRSLKTYYQNKSIAQISQVDKCNNKSEILESKVKELELQNAELNMLIGSLQPEIETFKNGSYTDEVRIVCYELLNHGVGSKHIPRIIQTVLKKLANISVELEDLPKATLLKYMSTEAGIIAKTIAAVNIKNANVCTLQTDGTTKKHNKYVNFISTTNTGQTFGLALQDHHSGDAKSQVEGLELMLEELASCIDDNEEKDPFEGKENIVHDFLVKFKNTMTDRHVVNKKFVKIIEQWRSRILPKYVSNWKSLSTEKQKELIQINDFYCGFHFILGLQDNFETNIKEWEKVESNGNKIGREEGLNWHRKGSATLEFIRSTCTAFGKDACEKSGKPKEFFEFIEKPVLLDSFRHNRFNVPFVNASYAYYHLQDMLNFISTLGPDKNKLMKAIELDAKDKLIIAGVRAMGILERQITTPLMKLMVKKNITAIDVSYYYSILHSLIKTWSSDPSELLDGSSCLFNNIQPVKDYVYDSLYMNVEEDIQSLTYQALSVGCTSFLVVTERMLKDHLPGGRFHCPSAIIIQETSGVPKHNIATERLFSGLDRLIHKMPNANTIGIEGILLWSLNKSVDYLDSLSPAERERLIGKARSAAPEMLVKYRERKRLIKQKIKEKVKERAEQQAAKENQAIQNRLSIIQKVNNLYGGPISLVSSLDRLLNGLTELRQLSILKDLIKYEKLINYQKCFIKLYQFQKDNKKFSSTELRTNLEIILKARIGLSVNVSNVSTSTCTTGPPVLQGEKRKQPPSNETSTETSTKKTKLQTYSNCYSFKEGDYVCVAYNEGWFVGVVLNICSQNNSEKANVKFMRWKGRSLVWPQPENVEIVENKYVFYSGLDICTLNGRLYFISGENNHQKLDTLYENYSDEFFT